jgi:hypothetical protein
MRKSQFSNSSYKAAFKSSMFPSTILVAKGLVECVTNKPADNSIGAAIDSDKLPLVLSPIVILGVP